jgi:hypothetical protein
MKKTYLLFLFVASYLTGFAQTDSTKTIYCELVGTQLFGKVTVVVDMGQKTGFLRMNVSYIVDENGKQKRFNSMVDAMNFMGDIGWDFAQAYVVSDGSTHVYHWLLTQRIRKGTDGNYYPATKKTFGENSRN